MLNDHLPSFRKHIFYLEINVPQGSLDPPAWIHWTRMTQGFIDPQNSQAFEDTQHI